MLEEAKSVAAPATALVSSSSHHSASKKTQNLSLEAAYAPGFGTKTHSSKTNTNR